ncbi:MAG: hypothetical protein U5L06_01340 [Rhodovibrio sp.]|nr:hypothetical protein [Rhodovibrio sp.]
MRAFGEGFVRLQAAGRTLQATSRCSIAGQARNGNPHLVLNFITPHQKWGIHSTYTDNLLMLTMSRGGPIVWISERDAKKAGHRGQRLDRGLQRQRRARRPRGGQPARPRRAWR